MNRKACTLDRQFAAQMGMANVKATDECILIGYVSLHVKCT